MGEKLTPVIVTTTVGYTGSVTSTSTQTASGTAQGTVTVYTPLPTLDCDPYGYLIQNTTLIRLNITSGQYTTVKSVVGDGRGVQSIGYNLADNFLWGSIGVDATQPCDLIRIASDGSSTIIKSLNISKQVPAANSWFPNVGDVDENSFFWASAKGLQWLQIDLRPTSPNYTNQVSNGTATAPYTVLDWAYVPGGGNFLYSLGYDAVHTTDNQTYLMGFDRTYHNWTVFAAMGNPAGSGHNAWGAVYASDDGYLYGSDNYGGQIWRFNIPPNGTASGFKAVPSYVIQGPPSNANDGARCIKAGKF